MANNLLATPLIRKKKIRKFMACDHVTSCNFHRKTKLAENWPNWLREKCYSIDDAKSLVRIRSSEILQIILLSAKVAITVFMYITTATDMQNWSRNFCGFVLSLTEISSLLA